MSKTTIYPQRSVVYSIFRKTARKSKPIFQAASVPDKEIIEVLRDVSRKFPQELFDFLKTLKSPSYSTPYVFTHIDIVTESYPEGLRLCEEVVVNNEGGLLLTSPIKLAQELGIRK